MNFCKTYFDKNLEELSSKDLIAFFSSPQKESQYLEFKSTRDPNPDRVELLHLIGQEVKLS